jgi:GT2 family glycosyltransferase
MYKILLIFFFFAISINNVYAFSHPRIWLLEVKAEKFIFEPKIEKQVFQMKLSVIIVNYNVEYFLEQCLNSVLKAMKGIDSEVIIIDNNSVDGSLKMLKDKFSQLKLIDNKENFGFSKANNQGIRIAKGDYILLLNPDTIVEEDTFTKVIEFMDLNPQAGGLGVKMLDGKGRFLPESKRGLPTPASAFYKMFGLSKIFPHSPIFAAYHQGHLSMDQTNSIEVLSGAFMLLRKSALDKVGLLDEDFFMYGEDIDLSYRLLKGGYKNYYFPETRIIHYKGESTKKNTVNYIYVFYNAMVIFAKKHYSAENAKLFSLLINSAIFFRAIISLLFSTLKRLFIPVLDFMVIYGGMLFIAHYWGAFIHGDNQHYPALFLYLIIPLIIFFWQLVIYYSGGYDKPIKGSRLIFGQFLGTLLILVIYALLPESYRFSRALILMGSLLSVLALISWRFVLYLIGFKDFKLGSTLAKRIAVVGSDQESERVRNLIKQTSLEVSFSARVLTDADAASDKVADVLGTVSQLAEIVKIHKINELIFCAKNFQAAQIIDMMSLLKSPLMEFKIAPPELMFIIGSNSINTSSDIYFVEINTINTHTNRRFKRLLDFLLSLSLLLTFPLHFFLLKNPFRYFYNLMMVLWSFYTFVGFDKGLTDVHLPRLKTSILHPSDLLSTKDIFDDKEKLNLIYARNYKVISDFSIIAKAFRKLDRRS